MADTSVTNLVYDRAIRIMFSEKPVAEGMQDLDAFVRELVPHPIWGKLQTIRYEDEIPRLMEWVREEIDSHQNDVPILFFCLSDMGDQMSLILLRQIRRAKNDRDWGAYSNDIYSDAPSKVLEQMYELAEVGLSDGNEGYTNKEARWIIETCYPLAYAGLVIGEIMRKLPKESLLGHDSRRRVAVFFGEGDDFFFGEITESGFEYYEVPEFIP